jgi:predicted Zn-dependent peptidase
MGIHLGAGTRDETHDTSGACQAIANVYLKTIKHTNETLNYLMNQMAGGHTRVKFDQESIYYNMSCIEYDVVDMFQMLTDIALEPKVVMSANVAKSKNRKTHALHHHLEKFDPFINAEENLLRTAYGFNTLGNPLRGLESNVEYIDAKMLSDFILTNVTP